MNFIDTEIDSSMKWLGVFVIGCFTIISVTIVVYHNFIQDSNISLGIGVISSSFVIFYAIKKIEVQK